MSRRVSKRLTPLLVGAALGLGATAPAFALATSPFDLMVQDFLQARLRDNPTWATSVGQHAYDHRMDDYDQASRRLELVALGRARAAFAAFDPARLDTRARGDRALVLAYLDGELLNERNTSPYANDPDRYSSGITASAFSLINRDYAPAAVRLRALNERLVAMPAVLAAARANLKHPPRIFTEIAIDQMAGNIECFKTTVNEAFASVPDARARRRLAIRSARVVTALQRYEYFLRHDVLPRSTGRFALGATAFSAKLAAEEQIDLPLERLLAIGRADLAKNQAELKAIAAKIMPGKSPQAVLSSMPTGPGHELLATVQGTVNGIRDFVKEKQLVTVPDGIMPRVTETPPYMRATTSAAMDTPGPFEKPGMASYYYVTLPDPKWSAKDTKDFLAMMSGPGIANLTVHEAIPGHYMQFMVGPKLPSLVRHVLYTNATTEGWAHYCEQMVVDAGYRSDDPRFRLAMLQDALVRDARLIVGIQLHTGGMTVEEATEFFIRESYLPRPVARSEAWRGTSDATYGYYTLGKLAIQKLRDDMKAKQGDAFSLQAFHDAFLAQGGVPLPAIREALLGERGDLL